MGGQELANTAWPFATVNQSDEKLFTALATAAEQRVREFSEQDYANLAWAFATMNQSDEKLFTLLARAAEQCVDDSNGCPSWATT